eukprot:CAMPEP_0185568518 /NCGR_PEP_ID=MMETSP0434-20130131/1461_1 /TAXON_ID=626734 ORGANISM="Favella taraikaensis, Strain Fe Narragansett Bay" /NCGR_SAMPLE_ID=MMETSP0434 /ASSEMBLY_ACC=CAM_ASM_000379 /LENGTH=110 /DNA_ID=CAMNT_0028183075 /DNA_START=950 /DNA_END=1281 /DNA_ORIENTATION=+
MLGENAPMLGDCIPGVAIPGVCIALIISYEDPAMPMAGVKAIMGVMACVIASPFSATTGGILHLVKSIEDPVVTHTLQGVRLNYSGIDCQAEAAGAEWTQLAHDDVFGDT